MVAAAAGVSRSTVSRVVNASPNVTAEAIAAVERAIEDLGYVPNRAARILASRRTFSIALVIPENTAKFFADPYFATVIQGVAMYLSNTRVHAHPADRRRERRREDPPLPAGRQRRRRDHPVPPQRRPLVCRRWRAVIPVVFGGRPMSAEGPNPYYVDVDNTDASREITDPADRGRAHAASRPSPGRQNMAAGLDRLEGWRRAFAAAGLPEIRIERGDFTPASGADAMRRLLDSGGDFDGVFVASAQMASGAHDASCASAASGCRTTSAWSPSTTTTSPSRRSRR